MRVAIDAVGIKHGGGATVLLDFLHAVSCDARVTAVPVFCSPVNSRRFRLPEDGKTVGYEQPRAEKSYLYRIAWYQAFLAHQCARIDADVLVCMTGEGFAPASIPHVTFIQQPLPFAPEFPAVATAQERLRMATIKLLMRTSCRSADRVVVQSPTMQSWVSAQLNLAPDKVEVVLPAVRPLPEPMGSAERLLGTSEGPKLLYVGSESRYKNVETAIKGLNLLRAVIPRAELHLTWPTGHPVGREPGVRCLGYLSPTQLAHAYAEAQLVVMPSLIETVGLPILEAMEAGIPVLAADRPYAHDIAEDCALFFDPWSPEDFAAQAYRMLQDAGLRVDLIRRGRALAERRAQAEPYRRMLDIVLSCAETSRAK